MFPSGLSALPEGNTTRILGGVKDEGEEIVVMGAALREGLRYRLEGMGRLRWSMYQGNYLLAFPAGFVALLDIMLNICISASDIDVEY